MKKFVIIAVAMLLTTLAYSQKVKEKNVPEAVKTAFQKLYPSIDDVDWTMEDQYYEAEFEINDTDHAVLLDATGKLIETEIEISVDQLPAKTLEYLKGKKIKEAAKITDAKGTVTYEAEVKRKDLIFDKNGNFIKEM